MVTCTPVKALFLGRDCEGRVVSLTGASDQRRALFQLEELLEQGFAPCRALAGLRAKAEENRSVLGDVCLGVVQNVNA